MGGASVGRGFRVMELAWGGAYAGRGLGCLLAARGSEHCRDTQDHVHASFSVCVVGHFLSDINTAFDNRKTTAGFTGAPAQATGREPLTSIGTGRFCVQDAPSSLRSGQLQSS